MEILELISGGNPKTLKGVDKAVKLSIKSQEKLKELINLVFHKDEIVRMRAADAVEKVCAANPILLKPYISIIFNKWPKINQPSVICICLKYWGN